ncbi:hypothetical protein OCJ37_19655 [Xanthomonas sp. AM6]|uniref:hypothetical protein n=1 Tax=Xanthomonas sp. AM6 TaxID=2982531 RepID=UPI0021DAC46E|nr:hypothetical protein [Xanthomonas sp. AM6]UYB52152.1 hypothetical protein OCJ37_19655 [Xanthomonas sp. AM6]
MASATDGCMASRPPRGLRAAARLVGAFMLMAALQDAAAAQGAPVSGADPAADKATATPSPLADFGEESPSPEARRVADWAVHSGDNAGMPYLIVDKVQARVFVFDRLGRLQGAGPALLGMERGDGTVSGIGARRLAAIAPGERTTPAGRYVASLALDLHGRQILWIDYDSALALHRIAKGTPSERRAERLQSATPADNRISYGCINVAAAFYERVIGPAFAHSSGVVYILPEMRSADEVFGSYGVGATATATGGAPR